MKNFVLALFVFLNVQAHAVSPYRGESVIRVEGRSMNLATLGQNSEAFRLNLKSVESGRICFRGEARAVARDLSDILNVSVEAVDRDLILATWESQSSGDCRRRRSGEACDREIPYKKVGVLFSCELGYFGHTGD